MAGGKTTKSTPKNGARKGSRAKPNSKRKAKKSAQKRGVPVFGIVVVAIVVLGALVLLLARTESKPKEFNIDAQITVAGAPLPGFPSAGDPDLAIGMPAPQLSGTSIDDQPMTIGNTGKPKVIIFLAHWCPHCQKEVPVVQKWIDQNGMPPGIEMVALATGNNEARPNYPPDRWLKRENWTVPTLIDSREEQGARAYGLAGYPFWAMIDSSGRVVARQSGEVTEDQLTTIFARTLQGLPTTDTANPELSSHTGTPHS